MSEYSDQTQEAFTSIWDMVGSYQSSHLDKLLDDKENPPKLTRILDDETLIQEVKALNTKVIGYLNENMKDVLAYLTVDVDEIKERNKSEDQEEKEGEDLPPEKDPETFKFPYIVCEMICCDVKEITQYICSKEDLLTMCFHYIKTMKPESEKNPARSQYFFKAFSKLVTRHYSEIAEFVFKLAGEEKNLLKNYFLKNLRLPEADKVLLRLLGFTVEDSFDETMSFGAFTSHQRIRELFLLNNNSMNSNELEKKTEMKQWAIKNGFFDDLVAILNEESTNEDVAKNVFSLLTFIVDKGFDALAEHMKTDEVLKTLVQTIVKNSTTPVFLYGIDFLRKVIDHSDILYEEDQEEEKKIELPGPIKIIHSHSQDFIDMLKVQPKSPIVLPCTTIKVPLGQMRLKVVEHLRVLFKLKYQEIHQQLGKTNVFSELLSLFFAYPQHNILHANIYTICRSIQMGDVKENQLILLKDAGLVERLIKAAKEDITYRKEHYGGQPHVGHCVNIGLMIGTMRGEEEDIAKYLDTVDGYKWYSEEYLKEKSRVNELQMGGSTNLAKFRNTLYEGDEEEEKEKNEALTTQEEPTEEGFDDGDGDDDWEANFD